MDLRDLPIGSTFRFGTIDERNTYRVTGATFDSVTYENEAGRVWVDPWINTRVFVVVETTAERASTLTKSENRDDIVSHFARVVGAAQLVDSLADAYLAYGETALDPTYMNLRRIDGVGRDLAELDEIVRGAWECALMEDGARDARMMVETVERARALAALIREAVAAL